MKNLMKGFIEDCISSGKFIGDGSCPVDVSQEDILEIEEVLNSYNDVTAKSKIKRLLTSKAK